MCVLVKSESNKIFGVLPVLRSLLAVSTCLVLSGCIGGGNSSIPDTFTLSQQTEVVEKSQRSRRQILIAEPVALKTLDSDQVVVRTSASSVQYLADAQWNDRLPRVFQAKLAQAFENSGIVGGVGLPGEGLAIDYQVITSIRSFEINVNSPRSAIVTISVKIVNDRNGVVRAQKIFDSRVSASGSGNDDYVSALDSASSVVTRDIVKWAARYVR